MSKKIQNFLISQYPDCEPLFRVRAIPKLRRRDGDLSEAVVKVVVAQMLSGKSADAIYARLKIRATSKRFRSTWQLPEADLRECGLSRAKARTICEFGDELRARPELLHDWSTLSAEDFMESITEFWGMSVWTASILALFYLGHEDIFPKGDGSIARALTLLPESAGGKLQSIDPERARPYRSYLALYLWQGLDTGYLA